MQSSTSNHLSIEVSYPDDLKNTVVESTAAWKNFCTLPQQIKDSIGFTNFGGYEVKHSDNGDQKELLHYTKSAKKLFTEFAVSLDHEYAAIIHRLVEVSERVIDESLPLIGNFLQETEQKIGQTNLKDSALQAKEQYVLRYLHYFPKADSKEEIAAAHCDIGGFTLHLAEDIPGLQYLDTDKTWKKISFDGTKTIIFPGMGMQHRTKNSVIATCHRVVSTQKSKANGRYSSVLFAVWPGAGRWNKEKFGSLSTQAPGFNYEIPHEKLSQYFDESKDLSTI